MSATRRKHSASATLEPPNLWTTQKALLGIEVEILLRLGDAKKAVGLYRWRPLPRNFSPVASGTSLRRL